MLKEYKIPQTDEDNLCCTLSDHEKSTSATMHSDSRIDMFIGVYNIGETVQIEGNFCRLI